MNLLIISPDKERSKSLTKSAKINLQRIKETNSEKYTSLIIKDYYSVIRELISAIFLLEGKKFVGENAHKEQILYLSKNYKFLKKSEIQLIDDLRKLRNKIEYDGFFIQKDYLHRNEKRINGLINKILLVLSK